ncbi:MAG TPA: iron-sulfur cluster assembly scaffold protein [Sphingomicrobium sp.]|nr:iron-sulfur cluster assembly scaffold protein [Sphingomicrobium sp.]
MNAPLYTTEILRLAASLPGPGRLDRVDGTSEQRSPTCGSTIRLVVQLDPEGRAEAVSQEVRACAFGQASASLLAAGVAGRSRDDVSKAVEELGDWLSGARDDPGRWPGLLALAPARGRRSRHGAILLPFKALLAAMTDKRR